MAHILPSADPQKTADADWLVAVAGKSEFTVQAASISDEIVAGGISLTILRNEGGEIVFRAPAQSIAYIRRRQ